MQRESKNMVVTAKGVGHPFVGRSVTVPLDNNRLLRIK